MAVPPGVAATSRFCDNKDYFHEPATSLRSPEIGLSPHILRAILKSQGELPRSCRKYQARKSEGRGWRKLPDTPEQKARRQIDTDLTAAGWIVRDKDDIDLTAGRLHVRRAKGGDASVHPISARESRALRKLQREAPTSPYVFTARRGAGGAHCATVVAQDRGVKHHRDKPRPLRLRQDYGDTMPMVTAPSRRWLARASTQQNDAGYDPHPRRFLYVVRLAAAEARKVCDLAGKGRSWRPG